MSDKGEFFLVLFKLYMFISASKKRKRKKKRKKKKEKEMLAHLFMPIINV